MRSTPMRTALIATLAITIAACAASGTAESARDRCESVVGVNNCVEADGKWVPVTSTTDAATTTEIAESTTTTEPTTTSPPTTAAPATTPVTTPSGPGDVRDEPAGQFCRDLDAKGYSYSAAVDYWLIHGQPNQMDADRNGIPCETVFTRSDVVAYWGTYTWVEPLPVGLPGGLLCKDLAARGIGYPDAVAYWFAEGAPDRMDADLNGIPCETVYSGDDVIDYWGGA